MAIFLVYILKQDVPDEMILFMDQVLDELTPYFEGMFSDVPDSLVEILNLLAAAPEPAQSPRKLQRNWNCHKQR